MSRVTRLLEPHNDRIAFMRERFRSDHLSLPLIPFDHLGCRGGSERLLSLSLVEGRRQCVLSCCCKVGRPFSPCCSAFLQASCLTISKLMTALGQRVGHSMWRHGIMIRVISLARVNLILDSLRPVPQCCLECLVVWLRLDGN